MNQTLQPPRYYLRRLIPLDPRIEPLVFAEAMIVPLDRKAARVIVVDVEHPLAGVIEQFEYTPHKRIKLKSIIYSISLAWVPNDPVDAKVAEPVMAGYSKHYDECFEHPFKTPVTFAGSMILSPSTDLYRVYNLSQVFSKLAGHPGKVLQFIA